MPIIGVNLIAMSAKQGGTSREYLLSRLERDGHFALVEGVRTGQISAFSASIAAGYHKRRPSISSRQGRESNQGKRIRFALQRVLDGG